MAKREVIELLKRYIALLKTEGISVKKAFLFGSYSNDTASENSDIDILIISDNFDESDDEISGKAWQLTKKINTKIEPLLIGVKKFINSDSSLLINTIKSEGIEII